MRQGSTQRPAGAAPRLPQRAGTTASTDELLRLPCDVLIPASVSGIITAENAPELQCKARASRLAAGRLIGVAACAPVPVFAPPVTAAACQSHPIAVHLFGRFPE